ncbi:MAG: branched-chain amino acid ABC transporter ATP-binding protein [Deltaproteobacteria bacterium HGW-Deltaproteobacteria-6]|nr:MAG: branched-chain amino acid ABC transporter ATP-binding protein [Deltaproteobacteria bacterium HGW-Deltaproteobacteria-6]
MLTLIDVETSYGSIRALKGISLSVAEGEIVALIGSNGAGKSTTLMSISGITKVRAGQILLNGESIEKNDPDKIVASGISQVPEGRRIFPRLSVMENLEMGAFLRDDHTEIKNDLLYIYELFPILYKRRHQQGGTLSGGEQQMLAISRALMARPKLLLLDEPSLGLSPLMTKLIYSILRKINTEHRTTIFLVEQNAFMALKLSHRAYVLENGAITMEGKAADLLHDENVKKAYLGI